MYNRPINFRDEKKSIFFMELRISYDNSKDDEFLIKMALMISSLILIPVDIID